MTAPTASAANAIARRNRADLFWNHLSIDFNFSAPIINIDNPDIKKRIPNTAITQVMSHSRAESKNTTANTILATPAMYIRLPRPKKLSMFFVISGLNSNKTPKKTITIPAIFTTMSIFYTLNSLGQFSDIFF